uniref:PEPxxWA-CTERM sorting domain-containing protein n=1 Tax=uncultured Sphingomonas sp. TaxID=158754 RepID=UPI0035C96D58
MKIFRSALLPILLAGVAIAAPASASTLLFNFTGQAITGPVTASFQLDSNPVPDQINDQSAFGLGQVFFNNVPGVFNGKTETASTIAFGTGLASQFQILGTSAGFAQFGGQEVFTGPINAPVFRPGTYTFTGFSSGTLTVTQAVAAVPETSTWAMLLIGFGAVGFALRRRKAERAAVTIA